LLDTSDEALGERMLSRRKCLALTANICGALALRPRGLFAQTDATPITRPIPSSGEQIPIIGLGSSATFSDVAGSEDTQALHEVFGAMLEHGGTVFDTAPGYGASEEVAARVVNELGLADRLFWATKLNVARRGATADPTAARAQVERSFGRIGRDMIDLIQVHNVADMATQFPILEEYKQAGRVRYIGTTSTSKGQYEQLERLMRAESFDFIGIDYAVDNLSAEERLLPFAQERGIAVMVYLPFGRTRLWQRVAGYEVPDWAAEFDATTWAQFFLKFAASHRAVTVVTPATSRPQHMIDNMTAARGRLPDAAERRRMIELIDSLPSA
jgi:aryl-alcohol dehydrogenase-like predicted oxidoreductase